MSSSSSSSATPHIPFEYLIKNTDRPVAKLHDVPYTTAQLVSFVLENTNELAFLEEIHEMTAPIFEARPPPTGVDHASFVKHLLHIGIRHYLSPPPPPTPPPAPAPATPPGDRMETSRPTTPQPPPRAAPATPPKKGTKRKHAALTPEKATTSTPSPPPPQPAPRPPIPAPPSPMRAEPTRPSPPPPPSSTPAATMTPARCRSPPSVEAFDKVLDKLAALRRESLLLLRRQAARSARKARSFDTRPAVSAALKPSLPSYADVARKGRGVTIRLSL